MIRPADRTRRRLWLALLCVAGLLARLSGPAMPVSPLAMLLDPAAICHAPGDDGPGEAPLGGTHDCELCPACHVAVQAGLVPPPVLLPMPFAVAAVVQDLPWPASPPALPPPGPVQPRAPPVTSA